MINRRHGGGGGAEEQQPLLAAHGTEGGGGGGGGVASAAGGGGLLGAAGSYGSYSSGEPQPKALSDDPPDLSTFNQSSSYYHLPGSRRRSSWVLLEKPPVQTIDILRETRHHRINLAIFLLATLGLLSTAIVLPSGWTLGSIVTTSVVMPHPVECPSGLKGGDDATSSSKCEASAILVYNTRIHYGLFGPLTYHTTADSSVHTQLTTPGGRTVDTIAKTTEVVSSEEQDTYLYWGQHFPGLMRYVRATQALVVGAWAATLLSLLLLAFVSVRRVASKLATVSTMRVGCAGLLASALALAFAIWCWLSIPIAAFSTICSPAAAAAAAAAAAGVGAAVTCTQLDEAFCADNCLVDDQITRMGSSGTGLVLFCVLLQSVCAGFWHTLEDDISEAADGCGGERFRGRPARRSSPVLGEGLVT